MQAHVARVHELGMKYLLWYSVPFVGIHSKAYVWFADKLLTTIESLGAGVLDPRYPEVREYLITTYEQALLMGKRKLTILNCQGEVISQENVSIREGLQRIEVPPAGAVICVKTA